MLAPAPAPKKMTSLPLDVLTLVGKELPAADLVHLRCCSTWWYQLPDLLEMSNDFKWMKEFSDKVSPSLKSLDIPAEFHHDIIVELLDFRKQLKTDFHEKNLDAICARKLELIDNVLPAELERKEAEVDLNVAPVFETEAEGSEEEIAQRNQVYRHQQANNLEKKVAYSVYEMKCCMIQQEHMLAECNLFGINNIDCFHLSPVFCSQIEQERNKLATNADKRHLCLDGNVYHYHHKHSVATAAAHFSSEPKTMIEYVEVQYQMFGKLLDKDVADYRGMTNPEITNPLEDELALIELMQQKDLSQDEAEYLQALIDSRATQSGETEVAEKPQRSNNIGNTEPEQPKQAKRKDNCEIM